MARRTGKFQGPDLIRSEDLPTTRGEAVTLPARLSNEVDLATWQSRAEDTSSIITIDLFSGCGGMSLGFENAGFFVAAGLDREPTACQSHAANFASKTMCTDMCTADPLEIVERLGLPRVDVVIGGPPCQGFSVVGRARVRSLEEERQREILARNELYQAFFRFIEALKPRMFVMENVPQLSSFADGAIFRAIASECDRLGYGVPYTQVLTASDYGVPQIRRRLFVVGSRIGPVFEWPRKTHRLRPVTLNDAIGDLPHVLPPQLDERLPYQNDSHSDYVALMRSKVLPEDRDWVYDHVVRPVRDDDRVIFEHMRPGMRYKDIDPQYQRYGTQSFHDRYLMLNPAEPGVTITAHMAKDGYRYIHWDTTQHRTLSVREAARVQSFGDHFRFAGHRSSRYIQIGNAVPPLLAEAIARQVKRAIERRRPLESTGIWQLGLPGEEHRTALVNAKAE